MSTSDDRPTVLAELLAAGVPGTYPGAVLQVMRGGRSDDPIVVGEAVRYGPDERLRPADQRVPMRADTVFDLASLTKLFTATAVLTLVQDGVLALDEPVRRWLPELDGRITLRHLLTHTSGLPAHRPLWQQADSPAAARAVLLDTPLAGAPGTVFDYSCLGYICAGWVAEAAADRTLPELIAERVTGPLGLSDTTFRPPRRLSRIAATEHQPDAGRGVVHGVVHDENSWRLGGEVGNAGLFGTAADLARFGECLRRGGAPVLQPATAAVMRTNQLPAGLNPAYGQGLGPRLADASFMGRLAASRAGLAAAPFGHTGFTGTSLVVDPDRELVLVLLTNRVHPRRERSSVVAVRQRLANALA